MNTPEKGLPQGEPLFNFLSETGKHPVYASAYSRQLEEVARSFTPEDEGVFRATVVADCPTTNEGWAENGVTAGYGEDAYHAILLGAVANGAHSTEVVGSLLDQLRPLKEHLSERISPDLAQTIITRTLNTAAAQPGAVVEIIQWAADFIPDATQVAEATGKALYYKSSEQLTALLPVLEQLGQHELSNKAREIIRRQEDHARQQAEKQQAVVENRAAEIARRNALNERHNYIRENALQVFKEIIDRYGITAPKQVTPSELQDEDELLLVANYVVTQAENFSLDTSEGRAASVLATALLDRAVELRRAGTSFSNHEYTLNRHEEREVLNAPSVDNFWNQLAKLAEFRSEINPSQVSDLYKRWRSRFIENRQQEQAKAVLIEHGLDPSADFRPEGIDSLTSRVRHATVAYDSVDEIIRDMREYFVPRMDRFETGVAAKEDIKNALGGTAAASTLPSFYPDEDSVIMNRLEQEIRAWAAQKDDRSYRDSWGDLYKHSGGLFTGHGIGITRSDDGRYKLSLKGNNGLHPTRNIDDFAAFVGKVADYEGNIELEYVSEPPSTFVKGTLSRTNKKGEVYIQDAVGVSLPVENILRQLQKILGLQEEAVAELWKIIESDPNGTDIPGIHRGDIAVGISPYSILPRQSRRSVDGTRLEGYVEIYTQERKLPQSFSLPRIGVHIQASPNQRSSLTRLFNAVGTVMRNKSLKSYSHGYVGGYNTFKPNVEI